MPIAVSLSNYKSSIKLPVREQPITIENSLETGSNGKAIGMRYNGLKKFRYNSKYHSQCSYFIALVFVS